MDLGFRSFCFSMVSSDWQSRSPPAVSFRKQLLLFADLTKLSYLLLFLQLNCISPVWKWLCKGEGRYLQKKMHFWISNKQDAYFFWVYLTSKDFIKRPLTVQCRLFGVSYFSIKSNHIKEPMARMHFTKCLNWCMFITFLGNFILYIYAWLEITKSNCSVLIYLAQSWKSKLFFY